MTGALFSSINTSRADRERIKAESRRAGNRRLLPWSAGYKIWWGLTVFAAAFTIFLETYQIAFSPGGLTTQARGSFVLENILLSIFVVDVLVNFDLAYFDDRDKIVYDRRSIARNYLSRMFWIDLVGVFPFYVVALAIAGQMGQNNTTTQYLALLRLFKMVRLHRVKLLFSILQYSTKISLMSLTLTRNFSAALVWTHLGACIIYFIARQHDFDPENTWLGSLVTDLNGFERYVTSLYWSVVTFTTVGYGDFSPVNSAEQIFGMLYMLLNVVIMAWMIGSITLLIVKSDEKTGLYRESLQVLDRYAHLHNFDKKTTKRLRNQLKLDFDNRDVSDEQVLHFFPAGIRRKILRRLYLPTLLETSLMRGTRQQFVDAFLSLCTVEMFSPGSEVLQRGSISSDLYLLLEGEVVISVSADSDKTIESADETVDLGTSVADSEVNAQRSPQSPSTAASGFQSGDFINELGFFTESPQIDTIKTKGVCKMLTMSRTNYIAIAADHPASAGIILNNLLSKVEDMASAVRFGTTVDLPKDLAILRAGSYFDLSAASSHAADVGKAVTEAQTEAALTAVQDLVKMHIDKQKDDHTTRFCFAASRGDIATISVMCDQGFDPNSSDYDKRTALMVASMNGEAEAVAKLLEYNASVNLTDMHGTSALYEAAKSGHEVIAATLIRNGATLSMDEGLAASTLCQAVFNGDIPLLKRLLHSNIKVDAADYDKRTASMIAAVEGNVAALKVLVEAGADLSLKDRWGNTIRSEAENGKAGQVLKYLESLEVACL